MKLNDLSEKKAKERKKTQETAKQSSLIVSNICVIVLYHWDLKRSCSSGENHCGSRL